MLIPAFNRGTFVVSKMRNYCPSPSLGIPAIAMCPALQEGRETVLRSTLTAPRRWHVFLISRLAFAIWCARLQGHLWQGNCVLSFSYLVAASQGSRLDVSVQTRKVCRSPAGVRAGVMHCLPPACLRSSVGFGWGSKSVPESGEGCSSVSVYWWSPSVIPGPSAPIFL